MQAMVECSGDFVLQRVVADALPILRTNLAIRLDVSKQVWRTQFLYRWLRCGMVRRLTLTSGLRA
jgi:hypothetical protein